MNTRSNFEFRWATPDDEADIRSLISSVPMPGAIAVRFSREPDYFLGTTIMGDSCDVLIARHRQDGQLAGIACRAERRAYLNGQEASLGYIGQIRVAPSFRGHWLVHLGAELFREASPPGLLYFGVIASENPRARQLLVGSRPPGNLYTRYIGGLTTCAILLRPLRAHRTPGIEVLPGTPETLTEIVKFLRLKGPRRQFFPAYTLEDFTGGSLLRGLKPQDIMVARRGKVVVGVMVVWDQAAYKQDIVDAYGPTLRRLRPLYNFAARFLRARPLTPQGQAIQLAFASCICIDDDNPAIMQALISACTKNAYERGKAFLMIGLSDDDPLLAVARRYLHVKYHSDLFAVSWSDEPVKQLDGRIPYIEIAAL
ncbi:MAG: hypothetical protein CVU39_01090 [Chloroflexi bacterium HGW-Chloroflexi-10]|nr:MAG: hypothetical protein CVU39_01090 [Chloroflexi bacterium HGW-Chloroflexi-10]